MIQLLIGFITLIGTLIALCILFYVIGIPVRYLFVKRWIFNKYAELIAIGIVTITFVGFVFGVIIPFIIYCGRNLIRLGQIIIETFNL